MSAPRKQYDTEPEVQAAKSHLGGKRRFHPVDHPDVIQAREDLVAAKARAKRKRAVDQIVAEWPHLTAEQLDRIAGLLGTGRS